MAERYIKPMQELIELWWLKALLGTLGAVMATPEHLPVIILLLFMLDVVSGIRYSLAAGMPIQSEKLRKILPKATDFFIFIMAATAFSKMHNSLEMTQTVAYVYVGITLLKSIIENLSGAKADPDNTYNKLLDYLKKLNPFDFFSKKEDHP